jgi:hypothetical protein
MAENTIKIEGNYLIIENQQNEATEFQLKSVFYKTENRSFIIRDVSYRVIIPFDEVRNYGTGRDSFTVDTLTTFLRTNTGSIGSAI